MGDEKNVDNYPTYFDSLVAGKNIQMIKTLIPFMPPNSQKILSVMVKVTELKNTIRLINSPSIRATGIHTDGTGRNMSDMLEAMKRFLSPQDVEMIDMFMMIMELSRSGDGAADDLLRGLMMTQGDQNYDFFSAMENKDSEPQKETENIPFSENEQI